MLETVVVALVGSAAGGLIGAYLQIRHERHERFRERMLEAADDLATALGQAVVAAREAVTQTESCLMGKSSSSDASGALDRTRRALEEAENRIGRVELLYGVDSGLGAAFDAARLALRRLLDDLGPTPPQLERAFDASKEARSAYHRFVTGAREAAELHGRWRLVSRRASPRRR